MCTTVLNHAAGFELKYRRDRARFFLEGTVATLIAHPYRILQNRCVLVSSLEIQTQAERGEVVNESRSLLHSFFTPVDIAPLVFFRITFGLLMLIEVGAYTFSGYLHRHWIAPTFQFTYFGFGWVAPPPGNWMYALSGVLLLAAAGITIGWWYRACATIFAIGFTWVFFIDQTNYLNHFYLICLLSFVSIFLPANRALSLDVRQGRAPRSDIASAWTIWILQAHMAIAYFYGGIAKMNSDWLDAAPVRKWFTTGGPADRVPDFMKTEPVFQLVAYSGLLIDVLMVPLLLWKRTRAVALAVAIMFHLSNFYLFNIGVFPFLSITLTLLFVAPQWHRKILRLGPRSATARAGFPINRVVVVSLLAYLFLQLAIPFRHFLYPGNVHWTEEGHRFAWHMMLRSKTGWGYFVVRDHRSNELWKIDPQEILTGRQYRKMVGRPDMILQFGHYLRDQAAPREVSVHAVAYASLNARPNALLVDPEVDLAGIERNLRHSDWILPLENNEPVPGTFRFAKSKTLADLRAGSRDYSGEN